MRRTDSSNPASIAARIALRSGSAACKTAVTPVDRSAADAVRPLSVVRRSAEKEFSSDMACPPVRRLPCALHSDKRKRLMIRARSVVAGFGLAMLAAGAWLALAVRTEAAPRAITPRGELSADEKNNIRIFEAAKSSVVY